MILSVFGELRTAGGGVADFACHAVKPVIVPQSQ
jgi:hypothetical protein